MRFIAHLASSLVMTALLAGCGGGSSSSPKPQTLSSSLSPASVTQASSVVAVSSASSVSSAAATLTLQGKLANDGLANADVTLLIGAQRLSLKADAARNYSIELPTENLTTPIQIFARGIGGAKQIEFAASLPAINTLIGLAGSDRVLTTSEYFDLNITAITTAEFVLMQRLRLPLTTNVERANALLAIDNNKAMTLAATLHYYATGNTTLPGDVSTTLDLALNTDLADAYQNILQPSIQQLLNDPEQIKPIERFVAGRYFLFSSSGNISILQINADGTGQLDGGGLIYSSEAPFAGITDASFTWERDRNSLQLNISPVTLASENRLRDFACFFVNNTPSLSCTVQLTSITLDLQNERTQGLTLSGFPRVTVTKDSDTFTDVMPTSFAGTLLNDNLLLRISPAMLIGGEWHTKDYSYKFLEGGDGIRNRLLTGEQTIITWSIEGNHLLINGQEVEIEFLYATSAGFNIVQYDRTANSSAQITRQDMVKRQSIVMAESDWFGRWIQQPIDYRINTYSFDLNEQHRGLSNVSPAFSATWAQTGQSSISFDLRDWRNNFDLLAVHNNMYYFQTCGGFLSTSYQPFGCNLVKTTKAQDFTKNILWAGWTKPLFYEQATHQYWSFEDSRYFIGNADGAQVNDFAQVSATHFYMAQSGSILELRYSSPQKIILCKYPVGKRCADGVEHELIPGLIVGVTSTGQGSVVQQFQTDAGLVERSSIAGAFLLPPSTQQVFRVAPGSGYSINAAGISGCNGNLVGLKYIVPARSEPCEITVNFIPN